MKIRDTTGNTTDPGPLRYFIRTFGCQMNIADSLRYARILENLGCVRADDEESSDILIINTCSVRHKAEERAISYLGSVSKRRKGSSTSRSGIAFVGCMATVRGPEIIRRFPQVRTIIPARELDTFEDKIVEAWPELEGASFIEAFPILRPEEKFERFLPIIRGCNNHCTYCIVPAARGDSLRSKPPSTIFTEIEKLVGSGVKSITFLGQNVCAYGSEISDTTADHLQEWDGYKPGYGFADLLTGIRDRFGESDVWFKFLTSHPRDVSEELIDVINSHPCFSRHFHLPFQAGNDTVLKRMARGYTSAFYLELVDMIRSKIPGARLSTDIIVGFPGEDEAAFEDTLHMVRTVKFDAAFTFLYSPRSGTPAEKWADPVPREEKKIRLHDLIDLQNSITLEKAREQIGEEKIVLVESPSTSSSADKGFNFAGRTREEELVLLNADPDHCGTRVRVKIIDAKLRTFLGRRID